MDKIDPKILGGFSGMDVDQDVMEIIKNSGCSVAEFEESCRRVQKYWKLIQTQQSVSKVELPKIDEEAKPMTAGEFRDFFNQGYAAEKLKMNVRTRIEFPKKNSPEESSELQRMDDEVNENINRFVGDRYLEQRKAEMESALDKAGFEVPVSMWPDGPVVGKATLVPTDSKGIFLMKMELDGYGDAGTGIMHFPVREGDTIDTVFVREERPEKRGYPPYIEGDDEE